MRPPVAVLIALVLLLATATVGYLTSERTRDADASAPPPVRPAAAPSASPAATPAKARAGKVLPLEAALKELDLIRPARAKLAEDFTLATSGGGKVRLQEHRGKVVMVNFWATWCPPCLEEMPAMERLYRQQKDGGFTLIAVSVDADPKKVTPFVTAHKLTFPIGLDPRMEMANSYGVRALPSSFIVARDGSLAALAIGPRAWDNDAAHSLIEGLVRKP
jgi:cytochrome c biogenesis protein CcmG/thiol:disulfide interchange protein DsbE